MNEAEKRTRLGRIIGAALAAAMLTVVVAAKSPDRWPSAVFNLVYETQPLDAQGAVDETQPPSRHYYKGRRSRIDAHQTSMILDCEAERMITVNWPSRTYTLLTFDEFVRQQEQAMRMAARYAGRMPGAAGSADESRRTGGTVTTTTVWSDSALDQRLFGLRTRYVGMVRTTVGSADACQPGEQREEVHRWMTDLQVPLCLPPVADGGGFAVADGGGDGGCRDRREEKVVGTPPALSFVLRHEQVTVENGKRTSSGFQVTALSRDTLADSLFAPPAGFTERANPLAGPSGGGGAVAADRGVVPGGIGVAIVGLDGGVVDVGRIGTQLLAWLDERGVGAALLSGRDRAAALTEASEREMDHVLLFDVRAERKVSRRGLLGRAIGGAVGGAIGGSPVKLDVEGGYELARTDGQEVASGEFEEEGAEGESGVARAMIDAARSAVEGIVRGRTPNR
ncbi:MAG: hypothetical protein ACREK3_05830 [Gemmatimonadota bacterium]